MSKSLENIFKTGYVLNEKWVIIEFIDKGAMGEVYRAHQLNLKRDVAIKVISQEMLQSLEDDSEEIETAVQRFRREVEAMARVRHPNILQIFDYGSEVITKKEKDVSVEYIVMEYIPGASLRFTMSEEGFYPEDDLTATWIEDYFLPLLEGVEAIHAQDIAHRDLKPENVLLDATIPKIADFGLAGSSRMKPVTQSIDVRGTPAYMSPEHFFDFKKADQKSDIYSLGKILFEAVEGTIGKETIPFKSVGLQSKDTLFFQQLDRIIQHATAEKKEERLVTKSEWAYAFSDKNLLKKIFLASKTYSLPTKTEHAPPGTDIHTQMMTQMMTRMNTPTGGNGTSVNPPAGQHLPDDTHARTASDDAIDLKNVKEWATQANVNQQEKNEAGARENINYPSLVIDKSLRHGPASKSFRYPWEAFFDVGFRCAQTLRSAK